MRSPSGTRSRRRETFWNHIAHDNYRGSQQLARGGTGEPYGTRTGNVYCGPRRNACLHRSVVTGREYVGEQSQVLDLFQRLVLVREFEQVEICIGRHHIIGLAANPSSHVDVPEGAPGAISIDVQADAGLAFPAVPAARWAARRDNNIAAYLRWRAFSRR